ncbi:MAG: CDP-alcohol phosphatidyltransferase family protein [Candidatus Thorarchaeota archaeon]|nr:MAG: hypothetical protein DRP09_06215 [Candidatus Thorarchaeota archaeon]RLI59964.1 MAG: hypothetical protein DRO87_01275 [Candidatus Thorarchaeota archaeon]
MSLPSRFRVRGVFRGAVMRVARPLASAGVRPNTVTYVTLLFAFLSVLSLLLFQSQPLYGICVFLTGFFDGVDGAVSRLRDSASDIGAFTDSVTDKLSEVLILFAVPLTYSTQILGLSVGSWALLTLAGWLLTSYTRSRAEALGVTDLDVGLGARSERLLTLTVFSLLSLLFWGLVVVTVMGFGTTAYRFYFYRHQIAMSSPCAGRSTEQ